MPLPNDEDGVEALLADPSSLSLTHPTRTDHSPSYVAGTYVKPLYGISGSDGQQTILQAFENLRNGTPHPEMLELVTY